MSRFGLAEKNQRYSPPILNTTKKASAGTEWHRYDVLDPWTFDDKYIGKPVKCEVYTDADEVEWYLNGLPVGKSKTEKSDIHT